jgi:hypothetical protein
MMNKIKIIIGVILFLSVSCEKDFLETEAYDQRNTGSFYNDSAAVVQALTAVYDVTQLDGWNAYFLMWECMSDNCTGGGGMNDGNGSLQFDQFYNLDQNLADPNWQLGYLGIYRANILLENIDKAKWTIDQKGLKEQYTSEARFLRAFFHFNLARTFGNIPMVSKVLSNSDFPLQASPEELYKFIAEDLLYAINNLPSVPYPAINPANYGRVTKWAAEAYLARVWLFYTDYYKKSDIAGVVSKSDVKAYLDDIINNGQFGLIENYADVWPQSPTYAGKDNMETVFSIKYTVLGHGDWNIHDGNRWLVMIGPRAANYPPYGKGWGIYPVNPSLYNAYDTADSRRDATMINWKEYTGTPYDTTDQRQYTGFGWKKYCPKANTEATTETEDLGGSFMIDNFDDLLVIRYSDVLLMAAELHLGEGIADTYLNMVRDRAFNHDGNHNKTVVTINDIMEERRFEFALEGLRYHDLLRQGLDVTKAAIDANSIQSTQYPVSFPSDKGFDGFFKIPETQVDLSNGTIKQSDYWESAASLSPTH